MVQTDPVGRLSELIKDIPVAILTTMRPDNSLHSCPMASRGLDATGAFWFLTSSTSEKVEAVRTIQRVNLSFSDPAANRYISVSGFCELRRDAVRAKELWNADYESWFHGGLDDPNLILMRIVVQEAEYWSPAESRMIALAGFPAPLQ